MKVKTWAKKQKTNKFVFLFFCNDLKTHYYSGTVEQLQRDISSDKMLGEFEVYKSGVGDGVICPKGTKMVFIMS